jgi:CDP-glucose 4,6-dehydratase
MDSLSSFYAGKRVFLTGHTGFKGGWLAAWLSHMQAEVVGFALPPDTNPALFDVAEVGRGVTSIIGDIRDRELVARVMQKHSPEIVIHNAAQPLVRRSYRQPVETYATNVMGTVHVLEAARHVSSVRAVVVVTSDKCYDNREQQSGYAEEDAMGGADPYSSSKGCAELVTAAYRRSFFSQPGSATVGSARAGNVVGGGDWAQDRLVPDIVRGIAADEPIILRRPDAVRPWQFVLEPIRGYLMLAQRLIDCGTRFSEGWNFGPAEHDATSVADFAQRLVTYWGRGELRMQPDPNAPHEARYLRLRCDKSKTQLGWQPALDVHQTVAWTAEWYRAYYDDPQSAPRLTRRQIENYMEVSGA